MLPTDVSKAEDSLAEEISRVETVLAERRERQAQARVPVRDVGIAVSRVMEAATSFILTPPRSALGRALDSSARVARSVGRIVGRVNDERER